VKGEVFFVLNVHGTNQIGGAVSVSVQQNHAISLCSKVTRNQQNGYRYQKILRQKKVRTHKRIHNFGALPEFPVRARREKTHVLKFISLE